MFIQIDDGKKRYEIKNQEGIVVGEVVFDPTDTNILRRKQQFLDELNIIFSELQKISEDENPDIVAEYEDKVKEKVNAFFNAEVVEPFEKIRGIFSSVGHGEYFIERVLKGLFDVVNDEYKKATAEASNRMNDYLDEYTEGEAR